MKNLFKVMGFPILFSMMLMLTGCPDPDDPDQRLPHETTLLEFEAINSSEVGNIKPSIASTIKAPDTVITTNGQSKDALCVAVGDEVELQFNPTDSIPSATLEFPDGQNHMFMASSTTFKWTVPANLQNNSIIKGTAPEYKLDDVIYEPYGEIKLYLVEPYIELTLLSSCSPDLLKFVDPIIQLKQNNGETATYNLSASDYQETEEGGKLSCTVQMNGYPLTLPSAVTNNIAEFSKRYDKRSIEGTIIISYALKQSYSIDLDSYTFFHGFKYTTKVWNHIVTITINRIPTPKAENIEKSKVEEYLNSLCSSRQEIHFCIPQK